ncbi:tubulin polyglutamylase ttll-4 isoform X2 [Contarinia nasturtii]|uniref:tubulin polyglutamylase ttll-4 isoform X2 n=1 Tax=Contarinia nasturtii TaxID=265458 RepID=UPI0012D42029|nr:tubulin polyglutamylase ttll-4 isoform X2 [Contarinia nasturtii]XP_031625230.1 tubulin polyglutamylase ttll-4 isoform X2 [Contarinia nasturtii]
MPTTTENGRGVSETTSTKILQDVGLTVSAASMSEWITGGSIGSRSAVLVFKTAALMRHTRDDDEIDDSPSIASTSSSEKCRFPPVADAKTTSPAINESVKRLVAPHFDIHRKSCVKASVSMSSSSENSISSACEDPSDLEADIVKAEKSNAKKINRTKIVSTKSGFSPGGEGEHELKADSPADSEHTVDDTDDEMPAAMLKMTYKFTNTETKLLKRILSSHGLREAKEYQKFNLLWTGLHMKPDILRSLLPYQRVNHFPRSYELTRKDRLYKNIEKMQQLRGMKHFDIVPISFMLPLEYRDLQHAHRSGHKGPWIVKPAASSRGRGIYLVNTPEQIPSDDQVIVSKYISDPLCIDEHKCDVRLYVVVTSFDPLVIYLYEEGLVRLATVKYDKTAENLWNPCMHLCNYSINKYHSDYIKATESDEDVGHKWTFSALLRHLKNQGNDTTSLMQAIEDVIIKSIFACSQSIISACKMFVPYQNNCFELYGFDILIDNTLRPWLLEVNLSPSLGIDTPLDTKVKSAMLTDLLTLIGVPAQSPQATRTDGKGMRFKSSGSSVPASSRRSYAEMKGTTASGASKRLSMGLSAEESRVLKNVKAQNARRGGFIRIFPTQDSMQRYGMFLDQSTGIPMSIVNGISMAPVLTNHNFNMMVHTQLYGGSLTDENDVDERIKQYERTLVTANVDLIFKSIPVKSHHQAQQLRKQLQKAMEGGNELTLLQARKIFSLFLECVLKRLSTQDQKAHHSDPKNQHEKFILKFITRSDLTIKPPSFMRNPNTNKIQAKDRIAIVAKLLGDYLEAFDRDTELCVDNYSYYGLIPSSLYDKFIAQASEADLEFILTLHVNLTQNLSFLSNRCTSQSNMPNVPPIPTGANGFLKALPSMIPNISTRDLAHIDNYYRSLCPISSSIERDISYDSLEKITTNRMNNASLQPMKKRTSVA